MLLVIITIVVIIILQLFISENSFVENNHNLLWTVQDSTLIISFSIFLLQFISVC